MLANFSTARGNNSESKVEARNRSGGDSFGRLIVADTRSTLVLSRPVFFFVLFSPAPLAPPDSRLSTHGSLFRLKKKEEKKKTATLTSTK